MPLNISTNTAALRAGSQLAMNQTRLQRSFDRLASGKKLSSPIENPGAYMLQRLHHQHLRLEMPTLICIFQWTTQGSLIRLEIIL